LEFRLLYEGELLPSGNKKTRPSEKHAIRRHLHPQLRRLWQVHPNLRQWLGAVNRQHTTAERTEIKAGSEDLDFTVLSKRWQRFGYDFIPLVTDPDVRCSLDVLLLRPDEDRFIFRQGDIDGQVKTLFDALRVPDSIEQVSRTGPEQDETPFFVLLKDDKQIAEVRVNSDQLLLLPNERSLKANDCFAVIHVKLTYKSWSRTKNRWLE
jgi:hypothetical protein